MEKRGQVIIEVEGRGTVRINYRYTIGPARAIHDIHVCAHDLANLLDLVGAPSLSEMHRQMGFRLSVTLTFSNDETREAPIDFPNEIMTASPSRLREIGDAHEYQ